MQGPHRHVAGISCVADIDWIGKQRTGYIEFCQFGAKSSKSLVSHTFNIDLPQTFVNVESE